MISMPGEPVYPGMSKAIGSHMLLRLVARVDCMVEEALGCGQECVAVGCNDCNDDCCFFNVRLATCY